MYKISCHNFIIGNLHLFSSKLNVYILYLPHQHLLHFMFTASHTYLFSMPTKKKNYTIRISQVQNVPRDYLLFVLRLIFCIPFLYTLYLWRRQKYFGMLGNINTSFSNVILCTQGGCFSKMRKNKQRSKSHSC